LKKGKLLQWMALMWILQGGDRSGSLAAPKGKFPDVVAR
jgi:hypothetical protein